MQHGPSPALLLPVTLLPARFLPWPHAIPVYTLSPHVQSWLLTSFRLCPGVTLSQKPSLSSFCERANPSSVPTPVPVSLSSTSHHQTCFWVCFPFVCLPCYSVNPMITGIFLSFIHCSLLSDLNSAKHN